MELQSDLSLEGSCALPSIYYPIVLPLTLTVVSSHPLYMIQFKPSWASWGMLKKLELVIGVVVFVVWVTGPITYRNYI